jgi:hypothetical protein
MILGHLRLGHPEKSIKNFKGIIQLGKGANWNNTIKHAQEGNELK